jgi:hypothetical protein
VRKSVCETRSNMCGMVFREACLHLSSVGCRVRWCTVPCEGLHLYACKLPTVQEPKLDRNHFDRTWLLIWRVASISSRIPSRYLTFWSGYVSPVGKSQSAERIHKALYKSIYPPLSWDKIALEQVPAVKGLCFVELFNKGIRWIKGPCYPVPLHSFPILNYWA